MANIFLIENILKQKKIILNIIVKNKGKLSIKFPLLDGLNFKEHIKLIETASMTYSIFETNTSNGSHIKIKFLFN